MITKKLIEYANQNPDSSKSREIMRRFEGGRFDDQIRADGFEPVKIRSALGFASLEKPEPESTVAGKISEFIGGRELAQGAGQALAAGEVNELSEESLNNALDVQDRLIDGIKKAREIEDVETETKLREQLRKLNFGTQIQSDFQEGLVSDREVIGSSLQLGATAAGGAAASRALNTLGTGVRGLAAAGSVEGAIQGAGFGAGEEIKQDDATLSSVAKAGLKDGLIGAGIGGAGAGLIGAAPGLTRAAKARLFPQIDNIDDAVGQVIRSGKTENVKKAKEALLRIDTEGIQTYDELVNTYQEKANVLTRQVDEILSQNPKTFTVDELADDSFNFVESAFDDLENAYTQGRKIQDLEALQRLRNKAQTEGLSSLELNNLSRDYNRQYNQFKVDGTLKESGKAEAWETTRKAIKNKVREVNPNKNLRELDQDISKILGGSDVFKKVSDTVNTARVKLEQQSGLGQIASKIINAVNMLSGGLLQGSLQTLRQQAGIAGRSYVNPAKLEEMLPKNLQNINKLIREAGEVTTEEQAEKLLNSSLLKTTLNRLTDKKGLTQAALLPTTTD